jgi:hypothetical protein
MTRRIRAKGAGFLYISCSFLWYLRFWIHHMFCWWEKKRIDGVKPTHLQILLQPLVGFLFLCYTYCSYCYTIMHTIAIPAKDGVRPRMRSFLPFLLVTLQRRLLLREVCYYHRHLGT